MNMVFLQLMVRKEELMKEIRLWLLMVIVKVQTEFIKDPTGNGDEFDKELANMKVQL